MKKCPQCGEMNGNGNLKCFNCGADLPVIVEKPKTVEPNVAPAQNTSHAPTTVANSHATAIKNMGSTVLVISIVAGLIIGFFFSSYNPVNLIMAASEIVGGILFAVILFALAHIAEAQEETTKAVLKLSQGKQ